MRTDRWNRVYVVFRLGLIFASLGVIRYGWAQDDPSLDVIRGRVVSGGNHPVENVEIKLRQTTRNVIQVTNSDSKGEFGFPHLGDGEYLVTIDSDKYEYAEVQASVAFGRASDLVIDLVPKKLRLKAPPPDFKASSPVISIRELRAKYPKGAIKEYLKGNEFLQHSDPSSAIPHYEKAVTIAQAMYPALNNLGIACTMTRRFADAETAFRKAISIEGDTGDAYINLGIVYYKTGKFDIAEDFLNRGLKHDPKAAMAYYFLGLTDLRTGRNSACEANLVKALELNEPDVLAAHLALATLYLKTHRLQQARAHLETFLKIRPQDPRADHVRQILDSLRTESTQ